MPKNIGHKCDIDDKYCQEGANPYRHPDHDSHIGGCVCELGKTPLEAMKQEYEETNG